MEDGMDLRCLWELQPICHLTNAFEDGEWSEVTFGELVRGLILQGKLTMRTKADVNHLPLFVLNITTFLVRKEFHILLSF